jgi:hypothetical protein
MKRRYMRVNMTGSVKTIATAMEIVMIPPRNMMSTSPAAILVQLSNPQSWALRRAAVNE